MKYLIKRPDTFFSMLNDDITSILNKSFNNLFPEYVFEQEMAGMTMPVDIKDFEDKYLVKLELPGIEKKDIDIEVHKNSLKVKATKSIEQADDDNKKKYHKSEFRYGDYCRTLYFPVDIQTENCDASLKNGILSIELKKVVKSEDIANKVEIKE